MSYTELRGGWCDIVWNPHAPTEDIGPFLQGIRASIGSVPYVSRSYFVSRFKLKEEEDSSCEEC
jgi:hypothetical protein